VIFKEVHILVAGKAKADEARVLRWVEERLPCTDTWWSGSNREKLIYNTFI